MTLKSRSPPLPKSSQAGPHLGLASRKLRNTSPAQPPAVPPIPLNGQEANTMAATLGYAPKSEDGKKEDAAAAE
jgi:hypothetical protein